MITPGNTLRIQRMYSQGTGSVSATIEEEREWNDILEKIQDIWGSDLPPELKSIIQASDCDVEAGTF